MFEEEYNDKNKNKIKKPVPFPFLGCSHNFPLTKSLTLNGLIPKQSTAYYFTICTLHPVSCSASVYALNVSFVLEAFGAVVFETFDVVCV